jgi:hypothetical protein
MASLSYIFERWFEYVIGELVAHALPRGRMIAHVLQNVQEALVGLLGELELADQLLEQGLLEGLFLEGPQAIAPSSKRVRPRFLWLSS